MTLAPGPNLKNILRHKFYATLFYNLDGLLKIFNQSECLKIRLVYAVKSL